PFPDSFEALLRREGWDPRDKHAGLGAQKAAIHFVSRALEFVRVCLAARVRVPCDLLQVPGFIGFWQDVFIKEVLDCLGCSIVISVLKLPLRTHFCLENAEKIFARRLSS